ncbi:hypothetical protein WMF30_44310 [Sorangium sp. So ce134]
MGDCYLRGEGSDGAGGGILLPSGVGGFGDAPPEPRDGVDAPPAVCNIAAESPCNEKCQADYEDAAAQCGKTDDEAQRRACQDGAHATYQSCRASCQQSGSDSCDEKYQDCQNNGPTSCLKKVGGQSLCQRCWERCRAGEPPSSQCRTCKF